jgi:hypothetical protein
MLCGCGCDGYRDSVDTEDARECAESWACWTERPMSKDPDVGYNMLRMGDDEGPWWLRLVPRPVGIGIESDIYYLMSHRVPKVHVCHQRFFIKEA